MFARMKPGRTYSAYMIAAKFHVPTKTVRPFLDELIRRGSIKYSHALTKTLGFVRPGKLPAKEIPPLPLNTSVAAPPSAPNLNSTLTGYEREIRSRVELCLMTRTR
ncbi:DNA-binding protein [Burkholderia anthina]|uniref:DNA-binding protein n=1 Tax=Burkholderia anthina TaxID=179879 RepID=UPI001AA09696|nr:DNA-binding protein [Burkholderia anthina]QTD90789.1 DNA-binding protein [Burkholderia anthina]